MAQTHTEADWESVADQMANKLAINRAMPEAEVSETTAEVPEGPNGSTDAVSATRESSASEAVACMSETVDHALKDALSHPKNRSSVLRLEQEVEEFVLQSQESQYIFNRDMTSYERLLAHRTAQHWGLETTTVSQGPDQGKIVAHRGPATRGPQVKLSAVNVTMSDLPSTSNNASSPTPRVLVRKRPDRLGGGGHRGGGGGDMQGAFPGGGMGMGMPFAEGAGGGFRSVEERQQEYHRARARIFGGEGGPAYSPQQQLPQPNAVAAAAAVAAAQQRGVMYGMPPSPGQPPFPMSPEAAAGMGGGGMGIVRPLAAGGAGGWGGRGGIGNGKGASRKAVLRNKHEDLNDPDFRRNRNTAPRFDPGFGEEEESAQQGIYLRPTYSSEFPELPAGRGGGRGSGGPRQSPRRSSNGGGVPAGAGGLAPMPGMGAGGHMAGMPGTMYPMTAYGGQGVPPGMMGAPPMGPMMVPPGMMVAGHMPGMPGGVAMYAGPGAAPGYYPMHPYSYYPMHPSGAGQEGMGHMQYAVPAYGYQGMTPPGVPAGFPGGPAMAAAMAAMSVPPPTHAQGGSLGRARSNGARSRNSGGGGAGNSAAAGSATSTPRRQRADSGLLAEQGQQSVVVAGEGASGGEAAAPMAAHDGQQDVKVSADGEECSSAESAPAESQQ